MSYIKKILWSAAVLFFAGCAVAKVYADGVKTSKTKLPTAEVLFEKHLEAIGGKTLIASKSSKTLKGSLTIASMGVSGELNVVASAPDKIVTNVKLVQLNTTSNEGYNGTTAWKLDPMAGNKILEGNDLEAVKKKSDFYADSLNLGKNLAKQETVDLVKIDGEEQYKVLRVNKNGEENFLYFSKATGLLIGKESIESTAYGKLPTVLKIKAYNQYEGLKIANHLVVMQGGVETVIKFDSVSFNDVPESAFAIPKEIQPLLK